MLPFYELRKRLGLADWRGRTPRARDPLAEAIAQLEVGRTKGDRSADRALAQRIIRMYAAAVAEFPGYGDSMWREINRLAAPLHELLLAGDPAAVTQALDNPQTTNLFQGFDNPVAAPYGFTAPDRNLLSIEIGPGAPARIYLALKRLAEAVGAVNLANPETSTGTALTPDEYIARIEQRIGAALEFPNFYPGEEGVVTARGVVSYRPVQAIYQAWRLRQLGARSVLEIGAGLGRTAFYARRFGIERYTIVDIPLSSVAQAHFLSCALGPEAVALPGEDDRPIRLRGPRFFETVGDRFDVVLNVDSLSEMDAAVAARYIAFARRSAASVLSINREWDGAPRAADLLRPATTTRHPYWMREGYVEELARLD